MLVVVCYDVSTETREGRRRLNRIAKTCQDYGQRVQNSVFECIVDPAHWTILKQKLINEINPKEDNLRFYFLGKNWHNRIEHHGLKPYFDLDGPLIL